MRNADRSRRAGGRGVWTTAPGIVAVLVLLLSGCAPKPVELRGVILFCIDTLRADHVGCYGYARETTPRIDSLASEGALLEDAVAHSPWTVPSVASLLSSRYPSEHGATVPGAVKNLDAVAPLPMRRGVVSVADLFRAAGYRTALFSANPFLATGFDSGFDTTYVRWQIASELVDAGIAWIRAGAERPFFLHLQPIDLHHPIVPVGEYYTLFGENPEERGVEHETWRWDRLGDPNDPEYLRYRNHKIALYDGALRYVDAQFGRLVDSLGAWGVLDHTLIVVTSDHGEEFWDHAEEERLRGGDPRDIWGIGHGHTLYQELLRVPLVFRGPGIASGLKVRGPVGLIDVVPTLSEIGGLPEELSFRGGSLASRLAAGWRGAIARARSTLPLPGAARGLVAESVSYGPDRRALLRDGLKLVEGREVAWELYDLRRDPSERFDLSSRRPETAKRLSSILNGEFPRDTTSAEAGAVPPLDARTLRELQALGYLDAR